MREVQSILYEDTISYVRHEPNFPPEPASGDLLQFLYDIPYFSACGVFPPLVVFNQKMTHGGGDGGMGPGTSWVPFILDEENYDKLLNQVRQTDPKSLKGKSRYYHIKYIEAPEFNQVQDQWDWSERVCDKYRNWYREQNSKIE